MAGFIGRVLSAIRSNDAGAPRVIIKVGRDGDTDSLTFEMVSAPGDDAPPLPADFAGAFAVEGSGRFVAGGFTDPVNEGIAANGEKRIYARDSTGAVQCAIHLKGDGSITISNDAGSIVLGNDGSVNINGAKISPAGAIETASGIDVDTHGHLPGTFVAPGGGGPISGQSGLPQ